MKKALNYTCNNCSAKGKSGKDLEHLFDNITEKMRKQMEEQTQKCLNDFQAIVDQVVETLRVEFMGSLRKLKEEVETCKQQLLEVRNENSILKGKVKICSEQIKAAERQSSVTQRRLNRADILISGLPQSIHNLREPVIKIAQICKVDLHPADIQHCCYIYGGKTVLVKLNSVHARDAIMANYFRAHNILLKDVLNTEIQSRIYLKDHLTPAAANLINICRNLRDRKKIHKYVLINGDVPKVRVTFVNGAERVRTLEQCEIMLNSEDVDNLHTQGDGVVSNTTL